MILFLESNAVFGFVRVMLSRALETRCAGSLMKCFAGHVSGRKSLNLWGVELARHVGGMWSVESRWKGGEVKCERL